MPSNSQNLAITGADSSLLVDQTQMLMRAQANELLDKGHVRNVSQQDYNRDHGFEARTQDIDDADDYDQKPVSSQALVPRNSMLSSGMPHSNTRSVTFSENPVQNTHSHSNKRKYPVLKPKSSINHVFKDTLKNNYYQGPTISPGLSLNSLARSNTFLDEPLNISPRSFSFMLQNGLNSFNTFHRPVSKLGNSFISSRNNSQYYGSDSVHSAKNRFFENVANKVSRQMSRQLTQNGSATSDNGLNQDSLNSQKVCQVVDQELALSLCAPTSKAGSPTLSVKISDKTAHITDTSLMVPNSSYTYPAIQANNNNNSNNSSNNKEKLTEPNKHYTFEKGGQTSGHDVYNHSQNNQSTSLLFSQSTQLNLPAHIVNGNVEINNNNSKSSDRDSINDMGSGSGSGNDSKADERAGDNSIPVANQNPETYETLLEQLMTKLGPSFLPNSLNSSNVTVNSTAATGPQDQPQSLTQHQNLKSNPTLNIPKNQLKLQVGKFICEPSFWNLVTELDAVWKELADGVAI